MKYPPDLNEVWYSEWTPGFGEYFKLSLLSFGQIESILFEIKELRVEKNYALADRYRNKLLEIGYYYDEDDWFKMLEYAQVSYTKSREVYDKKKASNRKLNCFKDYPFFHYPGHYLAQRKKLRFSIEDNVLKIEGYIFEQETFKHTEIYYQA